MIAISTDGGFPRALQPPRAMASWGLPGPCYVTFATETGMPLAKELRRTVVPPDSLGAGGTATGVESVEEDGILPVSTATSG